MGLIYRSLMMLIKQTHFSSHADYTANQIDPCSPRRKQSVKDDTNHPLAHERTVTMQRRGAVKQELLFVVLFIAILGGLAVMLTMRQGATEDESFVRPELIGNPPKPEPTTIATAPVVEDPPNQDIPKDQQKTVTTPSGLKIIDERIGGGEKVKVGTQVDVIYTGKYLSGVQFDSNVGKAPYKVKVGAGRVIKGWDEGLVGMNKGGKRRLIVPYQLAYGDQGSPPIPPRTDLTFEIEVVAVTNR
ncbi:MAG: FKBP-type peptidyl-prolyl cis-trans isomerase [Gemmatales bacterium]